MHIALLRHSIKNPWSPYFRGELALSCPQLQAEHRRLRRPVSLVGFIAHGWTPKFSTSRSLLSIEDPPESWPSLSGEYCCARSNAESNIPLLFQRAQWALALFKSKHHWASGPCTANWDTQILWNFLLWTISIGIYVLPMNCHCWRCFLLYSTFRQISMYSVHIQYMYTLNNIVHSIHVHSIQRARTSEAYATRLGARLSQRAKSNKWRHAHNSHNKAWPFVFQNGRFWSS